MADDPLVNAAARIPATVKAHLEIEAKRLRKDYSAHVRAILEAHLARQGDHPRQNGSDHGELANLTAKLQHVVNELDLLRNWTRTHTSSFKTAVAGIVAMVAKVDAEGHQPTADERRVEKEAAAQAEKWVKEHL